MSDYTVARGFENEKHRHEAGDKVNRKDLIGEGFSAGAIDAWLKREPPVLVARPKRKKSSKSKKGGD